MSEHDEEAVLRAQLSALVQDRPVAHSPAPLVIARVRRSRRRRAAAGALAVALAVTGGTLPGVDRGSAPTPAKPSPSPAQQDPTCQVPLPSAWAKALAGPVGLLPKGTSQIASSVDRSRVFVQQGDRIVQLTDHLTTQRTVMTLPAMPSVFKDTTWSVSGSFDGTWLVVALAPEGGDFGMTLGLYAWNASTGATRTLAGVTAHPTTEIDTWVAGAGRASWESLPFEADGRMSATGQSYHLVTLASGDDRTGEDVRAFVGTTMLILGEDGEPRGVSLDTGAPVAVPEPLTAFLATHGGWASDTGDGSAFAWGAATTQTNPGAPMRGPASWHIWWPGDTAVVGIVAPKGYYVSGLRPIAPGYAVASYVRAGKPVTGPGDASAALVDLRSGSTAPLTLAQKTALDVSERAVDTTTLPHLRGC